MCGEIEAPKKLSHSKKRPSLTRGRAFEAKPIPFMQLSDFRHIQDATQAFKHFCESSNLTEVKAMAFDDNNGKTVLRIALALPRMHESSRNIGHNPSGFVHQAVYSALEEWTKTKLDEILKVAHEASNAAEIEAAKQLSKDAINILSIANQ